MCLRMFICGDKCPTRVWGVGGGGLCTARGVEGVSVLSV